MAGPRLRVAWLLVALLQPALLLEFQRGAVERLPAEALENVERAAQPQKSAQLVRAGSSSFGTRRLPLREAVEHELSSRQRAEVRIPLRDAVESRPSPDVSRFTRPNSGIPYDPEALPPSNYYTNQIFRQGVVNNQAETFEVSSSADDGVADPRLRPTRVVCYLQSWAAHRRQPMRFTTSDLDPFGCTHLVYAFASLDPHSLRIVPQDEEFDIVKGGYRAAMGLKNKNPGLKVMISLGGWVEGARRYSQMANSAQSRREFIRSVSQFLEQHGFDGLDLHWEYPAAREMGGRPEDKANFALLAEALSEVFAQRGWLLSAAVSPSRFRIEDGYDVPMLSRFLDFINVKTYDFHMEKDEVADNPSPLFRRDHDRGLAVFFNVDYAIRYWLKKGAPSNKLVMGVPFYGRSFTLENMSNSLPPAPITGPGKEGRYTFEKGKMAYFEICEQLLDNGPQDGRGPWRHEADEIGSPYMVRGDQWVGFDDPSSIDVKMDYVRKHQLGGAVVWSIDTDDFQGFCGQKWPLLRAVREGLELRENEVQIPLPDDGPVIAPVVAEQPTIEQRPPVPIEQRPPMGQPPMQPIPGPPVIMVPSPGTEVSLGPGHGCTGKGFIGDPTNCRVYYRCEWGRKTTYVCPEGLHYDAKLNLCNWPARAGCEQMIIVPEKLVMTPLQHMLYKMQIPYLRQPPQMTRQSPVNAQHQFSADCHYDGLYSDPSNCQNYIWCQNGQSFSFKCPNNTYFDFKSGQCIETIDEEAKSACAPPSHALRISSQPDPYTVSPLETGGRLIGERDYRVVCYFTNWAWYRKSSAKFYPEHLDPRLCSHIVYAFAALEPRELQIISSDPWADIENNFYLRVTSIPEPRRGDGKVKVLLSLGGWTDSSGDKYSRLVSEGGARRRFVAGVVAFLRRHNFGGLHLDWHYPKCWQSNCAKGPASDRPNFTKLIQELKEAFDRQQPPMVLAVAISGYKEVIDVAYDIPEISKHVEFMSVMTYDYHGAWERKTGHVSPLYYRQGDRFPQYNTNFTMEYLASLGADRRKLLLGVPFYGQSYTLATSNTETGAPAHGPGNPGEYTQQPGMLAYYEVCDRIRSQGWRVERDNLFATGPYAYHGDQWVGYEDVESVKEKARYIRNMGYGGAMVWTVDLDDFTNRCCREAFPLLRTLNRILDRLNGDREPANGDCTKPPEIVTPPPPTLTTGVDTGASTEPSTTPIHVHPTRPESTTMSSWWTEPTTAQASSTTTSPWWTQPPTQTTQSTTFSPWWTQPATSPTPATQPPTQPPATRPPPPPTTTTTTTTTTSTTQRPTMPPSSSAPPQMPGSPDRACFPGEHHPDPTNCNAYYRCILGKLKKEYCAGGLHWSAALHACDWPSKAGCQAVEGADAGTTSTTTGSPWWSSSTTQGPWWTTSSTTATPPWWPPQPPSTERPNEWWTQPPQNQPSSSVSNLVEQVTPAPAPPGPAVSCESGRYMPDPADCSRFYICVNGRPVGQKCASGLEWNTDKNYCDWPFNVKCLQKKNQNYENALRKDSGSACTKDFERHSTSCNKYYRCVHGKRQEYSCAAGLHFNEAMSICDWPTNVDCDGDNFISGPGGVDNVVTSAPEPIIPQAPEVYPTPNPVPVTMPPTSSPQQPIYPVAPGTDVAPAPCTGSCLMVCYFTNWAWYRPGSGKYLPEDIDPSLCTHIVYGFAVLDYENLIIKMHDSWADIDNRFYERVTALKKIGKKVLIAIGGWNDSAGDKYSRLVNNPAARTRFIKHVMDFMEKHNFDGLDLDWEYPKCWQVNCDKGPASDKQAFADFIRELREAFDPKGLLLTAAVSPSKTVVDAGYDVPAVGRYLHYVSIMTYDFHGHWDKKTGHVAPLYFHPEDDFYYFNANFSINYWNELGVPRCNIIMGMPLYGQSFTLAQASTNGLNAPATGPGQAGEFTRAAGFLSYYEICDRVKNRGYTVVKDSEGRMGPYAVKDRDWVSYDDIETLREKARFITRMGLGGGMIWALDLDDFKGTCGQGKYPLLTAINQELCKGSTDSIKPPSMPSQPAQPAQPVQPVQPEEPPFMPEEIPFKPKPQPPAYPEPTIPAYPEPEPSFPEQGIENPPPAVIHPIVEQPGTAVATCDGKSAPCGSFKVVCYFTNWAWYRQGVGKYLPSDIDASLCTHIVYGFAVLDGGRLEIKPHDTWADFDNKFYEKVVAYRAKGVKVLLAIGGWNDSAGDKYSRLVNNPGARSKFISHVKEFIKTYNFDGLDLDWEYPVCWQVDCKKGPASDKQAFADFVRELRVAFNDNGGQEPLLLTAAVSPSKYVVDAGYEVASIAKDLDWIAVMTYDYHGQWDKITGHVAPMYPHPDDIDATFNANFSINYWINQGAPPCKIVMGMPMYGQSFSLADNNKNGLNQPTYGGGEAGEATRARGFLAYYEICTFIKKRGWKVVQDPYGTMGPYAYLRDQWVSFDDQAMIARKTNLVKELGLAGAMIWALDLDDFRNECNCEPHPLLKTINRGLCRLNTPAPDCSLSAPGYPSSDSAQVKPRPPSGFPSDPDSTRFEEGIIQEATSCGTSSELMPHKTNCNHYYQCVNGVALERNCPPGTVFIPEKQNCGWGTPDMANCGAGSPQQPQQPPMQKPDVTPAPVKPPTSSPVQPPPTPPPQQSTPAPSWPPVDQGGFKQCSDQFQPRGGDAKVICYFTNWAIYRPGVGKYGAEDIDLNLCTHVLYGFAVLDGSTLTIKSHDPWADFDDGLALYSKVSSLRSKGIKVLLALGGWNDSLGDKYSRLVSSPGSRSRFIKQALEFIDKYHFDGLDLDWEYPKCWQVDCNKGPDADKENFASLVKELSAEFKPKGLLLSAAVSPSKAVIDAGYDVPVLSQYLDWISVMTYDYHGQWDKMTGHVAPFKVHENDTNVYFNAEFTLNYYKKKGADPKKLIMGIPLYAQSFTLIDQSNTGLDSKSSGPGLAGEFTRAAGFVAFYEVCYNIKHQGWKVQRDPTGAMGPYAYKGNQWMSYDDVDMVREKMGFVRSNGLGGAMIWALDLDDFTNRCGCGKYPLLRTINEELRGQGCKLANCT